MSADEATYYEYRDQALIVLPGTSWEEWTTLWHTVEAQHKNINFWVGDALVAGQNQFGERFAEVVDEKYIHQQSGPMWVCSRIPPKDRRKGLSWSAHREVAGVKTEAERNELLDMAVANKWGSREIREEINRRKNAQRPGDNGGPPVDPDAPGNSTWNDPPERDPEDVPLPFAERADPVAQEGPVLRKAPEGPKDDFHALPLTDALRRALADVRRIAPLIEDRYLNAEAEEISSNIARLLEAPLGLSPLLLDPLTIAGAMPPGWNVKISDRHTAQGERWWSVMMAKGGDQTGVGDLPHLGAAMLEALMSAMLSDLGAG